MTREERLAQIKKEREERKAREARMQEIKNERAAAKKTAAAASVKSELALPKKRDVYQEKTLNEPDAPKPTMQDAKQDTSHVTMESNPAVSNLALDLLKGGRYDPASLVRGELSATGAQFEHQIESDRVDAAEKLLEDLRSLQNAANMVNNPTTGEAIAQQAGYGSIDDLNKEVANAENNLSFAKVNRDNAAQNYYDLMGREAVGDLRAGADKNLVDSLFGIAAQMSGIEKDNRYGGWGADVSSQYGNLAQNRNDIVAELTNQGFNASDIERALEYEATQRLIRQENEEIAKTYQWADENPGAAAFYSVLTSPAQGLDYLSASLGNIGRNTTKDLENYRPFNQTDFPITGQTQALREGASADMGNVGKFLFNTGMSMADSALLVSTLGPGAIAVMGTGAASNAAKDVMERGGTNNQALAAGLAAGVAEAAFEKFSVDNLINMSTAKGAKAFFGNVLKQAGIEATEEINTELANILMDAAIMGQNSNFNVAVQNYMAQGMTEEQAKQKAFMDNLKQVGLAGLGGFLSGGGMASVKMGAQSAINNMLDGTQRREGSYLLQNALDLKESKTPAQTQAPAQVTGQAQTPATGEISGKEADRIMANPTRMAELGINTSGMTKSQARIAVKQAVAARKQGAVASSEDGRVQTPAQETVPTANPVVSENVQRESITPIAPQMRAEYNGTTRTEDMTNGKEVYLRNSSQRAGGAYPGGQVSAVEEGTGRAESGQETVRAADSGAASLTYGERVSTASLGIGGGSIKNNIRLLKSGDTQHTAEAKRIAKERGLRVYFFSDDNLSIWQKDGQKASARGYITGDRVFIRVDHPLYTADQIMRHEAGHDMIAKGEVDLDEVRQRVKKVAGGREVRRIASMYADAYAGSGMTAEELWEEVVCDSLGDMNIFSGKIEEDEAGVYLTHTKEAAQADAVENRQERGPPNGKMSRDLDERRRALRKGEMVNEFRDKVNWRQYYQKIISDEYNPDYFEDGQVSYMELNGQILQLEMQRNGEWSVIGLREVTLSGSLERGRAADSGENGVQEFPKQRENNRDLGNSGRKGTEDRKSGGGDTSGQTGDSQRDGQSSTADDSVISKASMEPTSEFKPKRKVNAAEFSETTKQAVKDAQLAGMMNQGRKDAEKLRKAKEQTAEVRRKRDETIKALKEHQRGREAAMRESRNASAIRAKIQRHVAELSRKLRNPTDKKHIPEALRAPVAKLLESINLESNYTLDPETLREVVRKDGKSGGVTGKHLADGSGLLTKRTQAFIELKKVYAEIAGNLVIDPDLLGGEGTTGLLDDVIAMADKRIADMNTEELDTIWKAIRAIEASIRTANKAFSAGRFQTIQEAADALRSDNLFKRSKTEWNYIDKLQKLTSVDMLTPEAYFHRLGNAGDAIFRMMRNAQDKHIRLMKQVADFTNENLADVDVIELEKEMHTVKLGGQDVEMSTAQLMELYALMRRPQAIEHLQGGILPEVVAKRGLKKAARPAPARGVSLDEMMEAVSLLSAEQVQVAELLQEYASTTLSDFGNEASMEVYGYRKFNEEHYWPIRSKDVNRDVPGDTQTVSIAGRGFTKNVKPHADNAVMVGSIFDTFAAHASDMATYSAWLGTSEDVNRIRNFKFRVKDDDGKYRVTGTVEDILEMVHGVKKGEQYLQKLLADIANGVKGVDASENLTGGLLGNVKAASVGGNVRVVIQQPTAIFRAFDLIDPKYFVSGDNPVKGFEKAKQYAPIAQWKDWGYFDIHTGRQMKDVLFETATTLDKVKEKSMWLAGKMDSVSWGVLWNAVEHEIEATTDLNPGTEAFYQKVAERFNEVIDRTQVVDGILQRAQIMRDSDGLKKMVVSFMGEPIKQYNMLLSAVYDARTGRTGWKRAVFRTGMSLVAAGMLNAAAQSLVDALRDDDREQDYWEKWLEAFVGIGADEKTAVMRFLNSNIGNTINPMTYIPYVKEFWSIVQGYDVSRMDMDGVEKTVSAGLNLVRALSGEGKQTMFNAAITMLAEFGRLIGVPVANIKRDITAFALTAISATDNFLMEYRAKKTMYKVSENPAMFYDILFSAYHDDHEAYELIYADMVKNGLSEDKIKTGMESRMKKAQGVKEAGDLDRRYLPPEQESIYDLYHKELESSRLWRKATEDQRGSVEGDLYDLLASTAAGMKIQDKLEDGARYGVSETEYLLYQLALSMADKPTENGNYGSYTNDEVKAAIDMLGLSRKESAWLWTAQGKSKKSNPYK